MSTMRLGGRRETFDRTWWLWAITGAVLALMFIPVVVVMLYSLNSEKSLIVLGSLSTRWYDKLFHDSAMLTSLRISVEIAVLTALLSTTFGTLLAIGWQRAWPPAANAAGGSILLRLVVPETAVAASLFLLFTQLQVVLSFWTILAGHVALAIAFVAVIVRSQLVSLNAEIESAAQDLGASRVGALWLVVIPALRPTIATAGLLAFVLSFDDFVTTYFTAGVGAQPLPLQIYSMLRFGVTPEANAAGIVMLVLTATVLTLAAAVVLLVKHRRRRREATA
ncbi:MAG: ABC transporter permease [Actinobacteria bacterium]|nr:ABC transporter permease [Actinomycetota bacterium]